MPIIAAIVLVLVGLPAPTDDRAITYVGVVHDRTDLTHLGSAGSWFPQFDASEPVSGRPTGENAIDALPAWARPLNHATLTDPGCDAATLVRGYLPGYAFRSFSQDGPARSAGPYATITLPDGRTGRSGAIVDPHTAGNRNNTINRIQLGPDVPASFLLHVLTDNTDGAHDPTEIQARGNVGPLDANIQIDPPEHPRDDLSFNGVPDVYTFRFDGFQPGDYVKLRLSGTAHGAGASFGGLLFDVPSMGDARRDG